jgi:hypothetical protein
MQTSEFMVPRRLIRNEFVKLSFAVAAVSVRSAMAQFGSAEGDVRTGLGQPTLIKRA